MTAIISNQGLGLFNSSIDRLGNNFNSGSASIGQAGVGSYVNVATGNLVLNDRDEILVGHGPDIVAERTYNSTGSWNDSDGNGWRFGFERHLSVSGSYGSQGSTISRVLGDGHSVTYSWNNGGYYESADGEGNYDRIWKDGSGNFIWENQSTFSRDIYNSAGVMLRSENADGIGRDYEYDSQGRLTKVRFDDANYMQFVYHSSGPGVGKLAALKTVTAGTSQTDVYYTYDLKGRLKEVKTDLTPQDNSIVDGKTYTTSYRYDGDSLRVSEVRQTDKSVLSFTYEQHQGVYKVKTVTTGESADATTLTYGYGSGYTTIKNKQNQIWRYSYDSESRLTKVSTPAADANNSQGKVSLVTEYGYDVQGNLISVTDVTDSTAHKKLASYTYDQANGNRLSFEDAEDNRTEWTYSGKKLISETKFVSNMGESTTNHLVYDSEGHLRFTISAEGRVVENQYYSNLQEHDGKLSKTIVYAGGYYQGNTVSETALKNWAEAQSVDKIRLTSYRYDSLDQLSQTIKYDQVKRASGSKELIGVLTAAAESTYFSYDRHGQLVQSISDRGTDAIETSYVYDGMGRLLAQTNQTGFSIANRTGTGDVITVQLNSYVENKVLSTRGQKSQTTVTVTDSAGRVSSVFTNTNSVWSAATNGGNKVVQGSGYDRKTTNEYNSAGQLWRSYGSDGSETFNFYDEIGRLVATVKRIDQSSGRVTQNSFNSEGEIQETTVYQKLVTIRSWSESTSLSDIGITATPNKDRTTAYRYNDNGQKIAEVESGIAEAVSELDALGRMTKATTRDLSGALDSRVVRYFYSEDSNLLAKLDAEGYLTEFKYNAAGERVETISYAKPTNHVNRDSGSLAQLRPASSDQDLHSFTFYDNMGRVVGRVDGEGFLTEFIVDNDDNMTRELRYEAAISSKVTSNMTLSQLKSGIATQGATTTVSYYNDLGQLAKTIDGNGYATEYKYDADGRLESTISGINGSDRTNVRTTTKTYDAYGQLKQVQTVGGQAFTHYEYDSQGRKISSRTEVDGRESKTFFYYDLVGRLAYTVNAEGEVNQTQYDNFGQVSARLVRENKVSTTGLVGGLITQSEFERIVAIETYETDRYKLASWRTIESDIQYDQRGLKTHSTDAEGRRTRLDYSAFGELLQQTQHTGNVASTVSHRYDSLGRLVRTEQGESALIRKYDAFGNQVSVTISDLQQNTSRSSISVHDARGLERFSISAENNLQEKIYDNIGRLLSLIEYDITVNSSIISSTSSVSDIKSWLSSVANVQSRETVNEYDDSGHLISVTDATGATERYEYDSVGNKIKFTNKENHTWQYKYDQDNRLVREISPQVEVVTHYGAAAQRLSQETKFEYDASGNLIKQTEGVGTGFERITTYDYDLVGRQTTTVLSGSYDSTKGEVTKSGNNKQSSNVKYNSRGLAVVNKNIEGNYSYKVYDELGRVRFEIDEANFATEYQYGNVGSVYTTSKVIRYANALNWNSGYTGKELSEEQVKGMLRLDINNDRTLTRYFDAQGRLAKIVGDKVEIYANNTNIPDLLAPTTEYCYNGFGEQILERTLISQGVWAETHTYYDSMGRKMAQIDAEGYLTEWTYDNFGKVETQKDYARKATNIGLNDYDKPINRGNAEEGYDRTTTFHYDELGRVTSKVLTSAAIGSEYQFSTGSSSVTTRTEYDKLGNVTRTVNASGGGENFEYDALGRESRRTGISHIVATGISASGVKTRSERHVTEYSYNIFGEQTVQRDKGSISSGEIITQFYLDHRGNRTAIVNGDNIRSEYKYDEAGRVKEESVNVDSRTIDSTNFFENISYVAKKSFSYDTRGNHTRTEISGGSNQGYIQSSTFNAFGEIASSGTGGQEPYLYHYNKAGFLTRKTESNGDTGAYGYNALGQVTRQALLGEATSVDDRVTNNILDKLGRITHQKQPKIDAQRRGYLYQSFDRWGNVTRSTKAMGNGVGPAVTSKRYNMLNKVIWEQLPATEQMNADGTISQNVGAEQSYRYDMLGNLVKSTNARGYSQHWVYDNSGLLVKHYNENNQRQDFYYDKFGRQSYRSDYEGYVFKSNYNARGLVTSQGQIDSRTGNWVKFNGDGHDYHSYAYDQLGRRVSDRIGNENIDGRIAYTHYDAKGNVIATRDIAGAVTRYSYDSSGRKVTETDANLAVKRWYYDQYGNLSKSQDLGGRWTKYAYNKHFDLTNEKVVETNDSEVALTNRDYKYWDNGLLKSVKETDNGKGNWGDLSKDLAGWLTTDAKINFVNSVKGWEVSNVGRTEISSYDYDYGGKRIEEHHSSSRSFDREAHAKGSGELVYSDSINIRFERHSLNNYDARGRLVRVRSEQSDISATAADPYVMPKDSGHTYGSGAGQVIAHNPMFFGGTKSFNSKSSGIGNLHYLYDQVGNRRAVKSSIFEQGKSRSASEAMQDTLFYTYDKQNRMLVSQAIDASGKMGEGSISFQYDGLGRRISETHFNASKNVQTIVGHGSHGPKYKTCQVDNYTLYRYTYSNATSNISHLYELDVKLDKDGLLAPYKKWNANGDRTQGYITNLNQINIHKDLLLKINNEYDDQGRLVNTYSYAQKDKEQNDKVKLGDKISRTEYIWDKGNRLKEQKTYKRTENHPELKYVTKLERRKTISPSEIPYNSNGPTPQQIISSAPIIDPNKPDILSHYSMGGPGFPSSHHDLLKKGTYRQKLSGLYKEINEYSGFVVDKYNVTEKKQKGAYSENVQKLGYFVDGYNVEKQKLTTKIIEMGYDQNVSVKTIDGPNILFKDDKKIGPFISYTDKEAYGKWQTIQTPIFKPEKYIETTKVLDEKYYDYESKIEDVDDVYLFDFVNGPRGPNEPSYYKYDINKIEPGENGQDLKIFKDARFVIKSHTTSETKWNSNLERFKSYYKDEKDIDLGQNEPIYSKYNKEINKRESDGKNYIYKYTADIDKVYYQESIRTFDSEYYKVGDTKFTDISDVYIKDAQFGAHGPSNIPNSTAYDKYEEVTSDGKNYKIYKDAIFKIKSYTETQRHWSSQYERVGSGYFENISDKYIGDNYPNSSSYNKVIYEDFGGKKRRITKNARIIAKQYTKNITVTDNSYHYYRSYNQNVSDTLVKEIDPNGYGASAPSSSVTTSYQTRSDGKKYKVVKEEHFTLKSWTTTDTKKTWIPESYGTPGHYKTENVTTTHKGYFRDYYRVTEYKQPGSYVKAVSKTGYYIDGYTVSTEEQKGYYNVYVNKRGWFLDGYNVVTKEQKGWYDKILNKSKYVLKGYDVTVDREIGYETKTTTRPAWFLDKYEVTTKKRGGYHDVSETKIGRLWYKTEVRTAKLNTRKEDSWNTVDKNHIECSEHKVESSDIDKHLNIDGLISKYTVKQNIDGGDYRIVKTPIIKEKIIYEKENKFDETFYFHKKYEKNVQEILVDKNKNNNFIKTETRDDGKYEIHYNAHLVERNWKVSELPESFIGSEFLKPKSYDLVNYDLVTTVTEIIPEKSWEWTVESKVSYSKYDNIGKLLENKVTVYKNSNDDDNYKLIKENSGSTLTSLFSKNPITEIDYTETHQKTYDKFDSYVEVSDTITEQTGSRKDWRATSMNSYYSDRGELLYVRGSSDKVEGHDRYVVSSRDDQILFRQDGWNRQEYVYANGQALGSMGNLDGKFNTDFDNNYTTATATQQVTNGIYTVQSDDIKETVVDSLKQIARKVWGDPSLWYMLADANSITNEASLAIGTQLTLPTVNNNQHNNADTFKPYSSQDIIGDTVAEAVPPPSDSGCNGIAMVVMAAVAVVAAVYTGGAAANFIGSVMASGTTAATSTAISAGAIATSAAAAGAATTTAVVGGAVAAGAVGSLAAQVAGNVMGVRSGIDWRSVAQGGLAGGVGATAGMLANSQFGALSNTSGWDTVGHVALRSTAQAAGNYLVNKAVYNTGGFNWGAMAANVTGSVAGHYAGEAISNAWGTEELGQFTKDVMSSFAGGYTENRTRVWMNLGGTRTTEQLVTDAFGNAIGNSMVGAHKAAANEARMEQALKEQARQQIASHYKTKGMVLRGDKHYNDVISQYNGWDPALAAELALPDRIRGYGDAWDTGLAADYALPNRIRMYGIGNSEPEYIAKYGDPSAWKVPTVSSAPDNREVSADNDLVRELSFATNFSSVSLGAGLLVQQPLGKVNDWTKGFTMHQFMPAGHLQTPSYHSINGQIIDGAEWIFDSSKFVMPLDFSSGALNDGLDTSGRWLSGAGFGLSIYSAFEGTFLNEEAYLAGDVKDMSVWTKEWGKAGVDGLAAATSLSRYARFSPIGLAYTAADLTVQYTPSYTIRHGQYAGDTSDGWSKLLYMSSDQQIDVKSVSEKAYHELYLKRMPKY